MSTLLSRGNSLLVLFAAMAVFDSAQSASGGLLWQGFGYEWLHHILGFETPHRLGSFASFLANQSVSLLENDVCEVNATFYSALSPGVTGDFAHPFASYSAVIDLDDQSNLTQSSWNFAFDDVSNNATSPQANTELNLQFSFESPSTAQAILINGIEVQMECIQTGVCNSNASWIYHFEVNITSFDARMQTAAVRFVLNRAWAPLNGSGKPFSERMLFNVSVYYAVISSYTTLMTSYNRVSRQADVYSDIVPQEFSLSPSLPWNQTIVGMTAFSWELIETDGIANLGRYFEAIQFFVSGPHNNNNQTSYNVTMGLLSPKPTTFPSNYLTMMDVVAVSLSATSIVSSSHLSHSNICESSKSVTFKCESVNMKQQEVDIVPLSVFIQV